MVRILRLVFGAALILAATSPANAAGDEAAPTPAGAGPTKPDYLTVARRGWVFAMRSSSGRRARDLPPIRFDGKATATGPICVFGAPPTAATTAVLTAFEALLAEVFGRRDPIVRPGDGATGIEECGDDGLIHLRLYAAHPPVADYNRDLRYLDEAFGIGLPRDVRRRVAAPAQAASFFARRGEVAHVLVRQARTDAQSPLEAAFHRSILIEELFQVISHGIDVMSFDRTAPLVSKLQERPVYLRRLSWRSEAYMRGLLDSNPAALCGFDVLMLHALARTRLTNSNSEAFLSFVEHRFDELAVRARRTMEDERFAILLDPACAALPEPQLKAGLAPD